MSPDNWPQPIKAVQHQSWPGGLSATISILLPKRSARSALSSGLLEARLFASAGAGPGTRQGHRRQLEPERAAVQRDLKRKHVTLSIVWEEYIAVEPGGYRYSRFCELYRAWKAGCR